MNKTAVALVLVILVGGYQAWIEREVSHPAGVLIPEAPVQTAVSSSEKPVLLKDAVLDPLATFSMRARVLSTHRYWFDKMASLVPVDVAFGWGAMSDTDLIQKLKIWQEDRFYFYSWREALPVDTSTLVASSANMHLIPANDFVAKQIKNLRRGQLVNLKGYLVRINYPDGSDAKSSLTRTDSGAGACEIIYVQSLVVD